MRERTQNVYADMADRMGDEHLRDTQASADRHERARHATRFQVSDGMAPMTAGWTQYHPNEPTIEVRDIDGRRRYLTPKQHSVLLVVRGLTETRTMRSIAEDLGYAASTVSRALTKLASFGLIAYDVVRGRYGGIELVHAVGRELKERAQTAWQKIKDARLKAERRWFVKLERSGYPFNVAPYKEWDATLTPAYAWTSADMAEVDMETP